MFNIQWFTMVAFALDEKLIELAREWLVKRALVVAKMLDEAVPRDS